jgi:hypothetical protein
MPMYILKLEKGKNSNNIFYKGAFVKKHIRLQHRNCRLEIVLITKCL